MTSRAADWVFASIAEPIPMVSASSPTRIRPRSSGTRRIPATEASAKASGDSVNPGNSTRGSGQRWPGGSMAIRRNAAGAFQPPGRAGGPVDDDAHQIEADQDQEAGEGQKAEADEMAKRRGFPCQAKRVALDDGSQGQLQRREF